MVCCPWGYQTKFYKDGGTLYDFLHKAEHLPWRLRLNIALHIAKGSPIIKYGNIEHRSSGLDFLHSASPPIIHRDVKSVNILVTLWTSCSLPYVHNLNCLSIEKMQHTSFGPVAKLHDFGKDFSASPVTSVNGTCRVVGSLFATYWGQRCG